MGIEIRSVETVVCDAALRMPFHFANATVTDLPHVFLAVDVGLGDGETQRGIAAEGFSPVWFLKDAVPFDEGVEWLFDVVDNACEVGQSIEGATVFDFWRRLFAAQREWGEGTAYPPLLWSFGASMVERAVIDAFCRATDTAFADAVRENALGIELGTVYDELDGADPADLLPDEPQSSVRLRHTVGFTDPLTDDVPPADRLDDGLPQSLAAYVEAQGLTRFKVKLSGSVERDAERLASIAAVLDARCPDDYSVTLDANEQYGTASEFERQWEALAANPDLSVFLDRVRYVEQPLARDEALSADAAAVLTDWEAGPPVIIDESDDYLDSFGRALECGYRGTSHKNCKGVFRGLVNACLAEHRRRADPEGEYVVSAEDLTVTGPVALQQDLAVVATIGAADVERNGHHYFRGLSPFPASVQTAVLDAHGDLFRRHEDGYVTVDVADGELALDSVVDAPFGYDCALDLDQFTPRTAWSQSR